MIFKICRCTIFSCCVLINVLTIMFAFAIHFKFNDFLMDLLTYMSLAIIAILIVLTFLGLMISKFVRDYSITSKDIRIYEFLNRCSFLTFAIYAFIFTIFVAFKLQPGTDEYMNLMFPGLLPLIPGVILNLKI